jgi:hypothetical protein
MQGSDHQPQAGERPPAPAAFAYVPFHANALTRRQIVVKERGHPTRRPAMVAGEPQPA